MAFIYGTLAGITLLLGGTDATTFTAGNIEAAENYAAAIVDQINEDASATNKTLAANIIAVNILLAARNNRKMKGSATDQGNASKPARSAATFRYVTEDAQVLLRKTTQAVFSNTAPDTGGSWS